MATKGFVLYLLAAFSAAILSAFIISGHYTYKNSHFINSPSLNSDEKTWPELAFTWRIMLGSLIGFLGSAFGTVGGVGGGGIFVPMLTLVIGFDTKSAAALSKCMIMGASASSFWYNIRVQHPYREVPILDYDLTLLFQPMLMLGITLGVALSVVFPYWLITLLIIILFLGTSSRSFFRGIGMWKEESILKEEMVKTKEKSASSTEELPIDTYEPLLPREEKTLLEILTLNLRWKKFMLLVAVWATFLVLQVIKNDLVACSTWYWTLTVAQFLSTLSVFGFESIKLYKESKKRKSSGNTESICEATIEWTVPNLMFCALCGVLGGTVGGLLGLGGGFILSPLLLEIGVIPQVASATAMFVMMFSSSLSVVEFYLLNRFSVSFALYLIMVALLAGFWGQFFVRKVMAILKRASIIVFIISGVIFASALTMGIIGIEQNIMMIHNHEFMGFFDFCSNQ